MSNACPRQALVMSHECHHVRSQYGVTVAEIYTDLVAGVVICHSCVIRDSRGLSRATASVQGQGNCGGEELAPLGEHGT